jgi:hypothetical protein
VDIYIVQKIVYDYDDDDDSGSSSCVCTVFWKMYYIYEISVCHLVIGNLEWFIQVNNMLEVFFCITILTLFINLELFNLNSIFELLLSLVVFKFRITIKSYL